MKETQIISKHKDDEIVAQILDGKIAMITDKNKSEAGQREEEVFYADNDEYIFELYKVLKEVDKRGGFNHLKKEEDEIEKIYV